MRESQTKENFKGRLEKLDRKAVRYIRQWMKDSVFHHVFMNELAHFLWKTLERLYEQNITTNKAFHSKAGDVKHKEGNSVTEHLNEVNNIVNKLASMIFFLNDELQIVIIEFSS